MIILLATLAVYRVSHMLAQETGPFALCYRFRSWVGDKAVVPGLPMQKQPHAWIIEGVTCPLCISFWLALPAALFVTVDWWTWSLVWLGIAGGVLVLHKAVSK